MKYLSKKIMLCVIAVHAILFMPGCGHKKDNNSLLPLLLLSGSKSTPSVNAPWPDAASVGVPAGTRLTDYGTPGTMLTVTEDGAVFDSLNIVSSGTYFDINIRANNVTFRRCRYGSMVIDWGNNAGGFKGLLIEDCESTEGGCGPSEYTIRRCYIHGTEDGPRISGYNIVIEDSYIVTTGGNHIDCIQSVGPSGSVVIRNNTMENSGQATSVINVDGSDFLVENNLMAGGGFAIYTSADETTMRVINNRFSTRFYPNCGYWGVLYNPWNSGGAGNVWSGNVWHETGLECPPDNP